MKIAFITAAVMLATLDLPYQQDNVHPVNKLNSVRLPLNMSRLLAPGHALFPDSADRVALPVVSCKSPEPFPLGKLTDTDGKIAMIFNTKILPLQLSASVSGTQLVRVRLTYIHKIF